MTAFVNGEEVEYEVGLGWEKAHYVGPCPMNPAYHVLQKNDGDFNTRTVKCIRKPKVKKEGWINVYRSGTTGGVIYRTKEAAERGAAVADHAAGRSECARLVDSIRIEWYE